MDTARKDKILTASRLASEKHVDWIALAVIKVKQAVPQLSFDIYGHGPEKIKFNKSSVNIMPKTTFTYEVTSILMKFTHNMNYLYQHHKVKALA